MTKIKICGIVRPVDAYAVNLCRPDYAGFVFAENRRRTVSSDHAEMLRDIISCDVKAVGVFQNNEPEYILKLCERGIIDLIQLHGDEDERYIHYLRLHTPLPIIKAVQAKDTETVLRAQELSSDYLLIDTYDEKTNGGTGKSFDYSVLPKLTKPFFIAGGLNSSNIKKALGVGAYGVDVSSGVETNGFKDTEKIAEIIKMIRSE